MKKQDSNISKETLRQFALRLYSFTLGVAFGVFVSLGPVALISHRHLSTFISEQALAKLCFYLLTPLATGYIAMSCQAKASPIEEKTSKDWRARFALVRKKNAEILGTLAIFLFVACACLCEKLAIAPLAESDSLKLVCQTAGLFVIIGSVTVEFVCPQLLETKPQFQGTKPHWRWTLGNLASYNWLVFLVGVALLFATWFPLLAIPGLIIAVNWRLRSDIEKWRTDSDCLLPSANKSSYLNPTPSLGHDDSPL